MATDDAHTAGTETTPAGSDKAPATAPSGRKSWLKGRWEKWTAADTHNQVLVVVSTCAMLATATNAALTYFTFQMNKESGKKASEQNDRMIANANRIAAAMQGNLEQSKAALEATIASTRGDQRAWVVIKDVKLGEEPQVGKTPQITIEISNGGKTPALNLNVRAAGYIGRIVGSGPVTVEEVFPAPIPIEISSNPASGSDMLGSNITAAFSYKGARSKLTSEAIEAYQSGEACYFVSGRVDYQDVFKRWHWIKFSVRIAPEDRETLRFSISPVGNSSDDD